MTAPTLHVNNQYACFSCFHAANHADQKAKDIYGKYTKDTRTTLRFKFFILSFFQGFYIVFCRIPYRVFTLLSGDFIHVGYWKAKKEWQIKRQVWSLHYPENKYLPGKISLIFKTTKHALIQLVKNIIKIATYPLALIALEFATIFGMFFPFSGRVFYAKIEHGWARDNIIYSNDVIGHLQLRLSDYLAPCMLPLHVAKPLLPNLIRDYHPGTLRSLIGRTEKYLTIHRTFFENEKVDVSHILERLAHYHQHMRRFSYIDSSELDPQGRLKHNACQILIANKLYGVLANLKDIRQMRECILFTQIQDKKHQKLKKIISDCRSIIQTNIQFLNQIFYFSNTESN